jgi:AraC-like DNA-binding protein
MKATIKNQIRLVIMIVCAVLLTAPAIVVAEETLLQANLTRTRQADEFKGYDFFPEYHQEARMKEKARHCQEESRTIQTVARKGGFIAVVIKMFRFNPPNMMNLVCCFTDVERF